MIIDDLRFKLRDGREAMLRSPKEEDVESTLEYLVVSRKNARLKGRIIPWIMQ